MNTMSHALNWADYIIIGIMVFSTLTSILRGFISEAISLVTWIIAAIIALKFMHPLSIYLQNLIRTPSLRLLVAFIIIFILIIIIGSIINHFLSIFVKNTGLSGTNRLLGMIFGFARGILLISIFILFAKMTSLTRSPWWQGSQLIPYFLNIASWLEQLIPAQLTSMFHLFLTPKAGNS